MKNNYSKIISFLLTSLLVLALFVGCSNTNGTGTTNDKTQSQNPTNNANTSTNKPSGDTTNNPTNTTNDNATNNKMPSTNMNNEKTFTLDELAKYDGKNGQPAYIAVDGVVYDVTNNFPNGDHHGCVAGTDSTESIKKVSHGSAILSNSPIVGKLVG